MSSPVFDLSTVNTSLTNQNLRVYRHPLGETVDLSGIPKVKVDITDNFGGDNSKTHWDVSSLPATSPVVTTARQLASELKALLPGYRVTMMTRKTEVWGKPEEVSTVSLNLSFAHSRQQCYVYFVFA